MSKLRRLRQKIYQDLMKPSNNPNEGWIIFYDDEDGKRHYFEKIYTIGRTKFNTKKFSIFRNIIDCHEYLEKIQESIKLYGAIPGNKDKKVKLMAAQATIS